MAFTVRSLYAKVGTFRPDIVETNQAAVGYAIQEIVRQIARETGLMREILVPFNVSAFSASTTITPTSSNDLLRIIDVKVFPTPINAHYVATWNAATNTPTIPAASSANINYYYLTTTAGTTTVNGVSDWRVGDILVSDGVQWIAYPLQQYKTVREKARPTQDYLYQRNQFSKQVPQGWSQEKGVLRFYPRTHADAPFLVELSYAPVGDLDTINLPAETEDAIVLGAKSAMLLLPGEHQDKQLAKAFDTKYQIALTSLRIIAEQGYGGSPIAESPCYQEGWP